MDLDEQVGERSKCAYNTLFTGIVQTRIFYSGIPLRINAEKIRSDVDGLNASP